MTCQVSGRLEGSPVPAAIPRDGDQAPGAGQPSGTSAEDGVPGGGVLKGRNREDEPRHECQRDRALSQQRAPPASSGLADSLTELHAARLLTYHAAHAFDTLADRKVVHGKVAMAKLYASEMAGRVADRAVQIFGGRGYMHENSAARFYRELRVDRIWEGTSEIQRVIIARGLERRGVESMLR